MTAAQATERVTRPFELFFQAFANPTRMKIISFLERRKESGASVSEICRDLDIEQTQASHALRCLAFCGVVNSARQGKSIIYSLNEKTIIPILALVDAHMNRYASNLLTCDTLER